VKLILVLATVVLEILLVNFLEIVKIVRTFGIDTFVYDKVLSVLLGLKRMAAVRTFKSE
jgi:hypothetical protein